VALAHLDYRRHAGELVRFFVNCIEQGKERRFKPTPISKRRRALLASRNCLCGMLALGVIASGRVRRAKKRALSGEVVTAIYFHKPNKRLFAQCVRWLTKNGYHFISASDLLDILYRDKTSPKGAVWLSFDDGCKEILENVISPTLSQQIPVMLFIPTGIVQGDGRFPWLHKKASVTSASGPRNSLTADELIHVASYPHVAVGSHTVSHANTNDLTEVEARVELGKSKRTLESWTGAEVKCFAYPEGRFDQRERLLLKEFGYTLAATTQNAFVAPETDPYLLPRFSVADDIFFPEAICNMVGVWRPVIDPILVFIGHLRRIPEPWRRFRETEHLEKKRQSA
jgi:peptidoglycan/xylan/chitin deacetylase (PgdA/CDA1 family)